MKRPVEKTEKIVIFGNLAIIAGGRIFKERIVSKVTI